MKSTIKIFAIFAMVVGFAVGAKAQINIPAKAQVMKALTISEGQQLSFGLVTKGVSKTISNSGSVLIGGAGTGKVGVGAEQAGTFTVDKGEDTAVTLTFTLPTNLSDGTHDLPITFVDYSGNKLGKLTGSGITAYEFSFSSGASSELKITSELTDFYHIGQFGVNIGGTVSPISNQTEGVYSGTIGLSAVYN